jgi:predicted transcriptional regulator
MFFQQIQSEWFVERSAYVLKMLGHPVRLKIVQCLLSQQQSNVKHIWEALEIHQATISKHLATLRNGGIVTGIRKANEVYYHVSCNISEKIVSSAIHKSNN